MSQNVCPEDATPMQKLGFQIWGSLDTPSSIEFERRAVELDLKKILKPTSSIAPHYRIDGAVLTPTFGRGYMEAKNNLDMRESDVVLAGFPKTGTTWLQEIIYSVLHVHELDAPITESIDIRAPYLEIPECGFKEIQSRSSPRFMKSHLHYDLLPSRGCDKKYKIIVSTRNPKDTAVSLYHFMKMFAPFNFQGDLTDAVNLFLNDTILAGPFWKHALSFWNHRNDANILIIKFEDLCNDMIGEIKKIAAFLNVEMDESLVNKVAHRCGFDQMSSNPNCNHKQWSDKNLTSTGEFKFMRKGKIGDWKVHFDEDLNKRFDEWIEKNLGSSGLTYQYE